MAHFKYYLILLIATFSLSIMLPTIAGWSAHTLPPTPAASQQLSVIQAFAADFYHRNGTQRTVSVRRYAVEGNYALLEWTSGEMGGMALLLKASTQWTLIDQGGGAMDTNTLIQAGVPPAQARQLYQAFQQQKLNPL
ncbi:MAG: hypothetical protein KME12_23005 [Trichocoleus desertorum ATA4-8-CV12]|jgi:hypothetical protein|nr:hypothetical protein [Trichocoleus desertorum ATA4-8-CV12]